MGQRNGDRYREFAMVDLLETVSAFRLACFAEVFEKETEPVWILQVV
jgi:hypothetical protein